MIIVITFFTLVTSFLGGALFATTLLLKDRQILIERHQEIINELNSRKK